MKPLTVKQQLRARTKVFKLLAGIGFQHDTQGDYWWKQIGLSGQRCCVAFGVPNQCLGGTTEWVWQTSPMDKSPRFGYSGSTSLGSAFGTVGRVLDITLEQFYYTGMIEEGRRESLRTKEVKAKVAKALDELRSYV